MSRVTVMPRNGDWTVDDLDRLPDDGLQYELADGVLLVTPGPVLRRSARSGSRSSDRSRSSCSRTSCWADRVKPPRPPADALGVEDLLETASRCPHCRASVRPGAPWCTLCHADLRPAPSPEPEPVAAVAPVVRQIDPLTAPAPALGLPPKPGDEPTWPCTTCGAANPIAANACTSCGAGFLAGLRETEAPLLELPGVGDLTKMSRAQRLGIAFGVVLAFIAVIALLSLLLG